MVDLKIDWQRSAISRAREQLTIGDCIDRETIFPIPIEDLTGVSDSDLRGQLGAERLAHQIGGETLIRALTGLQARGVRFWLAPRLIKAGIRNTAPKAEPQPETLDLVQAAMNRAEELRRAEEERDAEGMKAELGRLVRLLHRDGSRSMSCPSNGKSRMPAYWMRRAEAKQSAGEDRPA